MTGVSGPGGAHHDQLDQGQSPEEPTCERIRGDPVDHA
jgi:hypothetical protein